MKLPFADRSFELDESIIVMGIALLCLGMLVSFGRPKHLPASLNEASVYDSAHTSSL